MNRFEEKMRLMQEFITAYENNDMEALSKIDMNELPDINVMKAFVQARREVGQKLSGQDENNK